MLNQDPILEKYILDHTDPEGEVLEELNRFTHTNILNPNMLSGHLQGRILEMISKMVSPSRILEIGTYTGYSAICLARGLRERGKLITIDTNDELAEVRRTCFRKADVDHLIESRHGDALLIIPGLKGSFDLVFIDGEKTEYTAYYHAVIEKVNPGGYLLADNVLWGGEILDPEPDWDAATKAIHAFNTLVQQDQRVENILLPVRDGLMIMRKKNNLP